MTNSINMDKSIENPELKLDLKGHKQAITSIKYSPVGGSLISSSKDHNVLIWNMESPDRVYKFSAHLGSVTDVDYTLDGRHFVSSSADRTIRIWSSKLVGKTSELGKHEKAVNSVHLRYDDQKLLSTSNDKSIKLWDVQQKRFLHSLVGHSHWVNGAQWTYDGKLAISCGEDKKIKVWDVENQLCIHTFQMSSAANKISLFGNYIACAMDSGSVRILDICNKKMMQHYKLTGSCTAVSWYPNGKFLIAGFGDGKMRVIDTMEGHPLYSIEVTNHPVPINAVAFDKSGDHFACSANESVLIWKSNIINDELEFKSDSYL